MGTTVPREAAAHVLEGEVLRCSFTHATIHCPAQGVHLTRMVCVLLDHVQEHGANDGLEVPMDPNQYLVAVEATATCLPHRGSGHLLLFAPDRAFEGVTPLLGCRRTR
jgi:hypothetical protein